MKKHNLIIGDNVYTVELAKVDGVYSYDFKRNGKSQSSTTAPIENRDEIKMWISEKLIQTAIYDINHFVGKMKL